MYEIKVIMPPAGQLFEGNRLKQAIVSAAKSCAAGAKVDFKTTTRTWEHQPEFQAVQQGDSFLVGTDDTIYGYVNKGTKPHLILPRRGRRLTWLGTNYRAKTTPGRIGSTRGGNDNTIVWARKVHHPGTEARNFDTAIRDKWAKIMPQRIEQALAAAVEGKASPTTTWTD